MKNKAVLNEAMTENLHQLQHEVRTLRQQLDELKRTCALFCHPARTCHHCVRTHSLCTPAAIHGADLQGGSTAPLGAAAVDSATAAARVGGAASSAVPELHNKTGRLLEKLDRVIFKSMQTAERSVTSPEVQAMVAKIGGLLEDDEAATRALCVNAKMFGEMVLKSTKTVQPASALQCLSYIDERLADLQRTNPALESSIPLLVKAAAGAGSRVNKLESLVADLLQRTERAEGEAGALRDQLRDTEHMVCTLEHEAQKDKALIALLHDRVQVAAHCMPTTTRSLSAGPASEVALSTPAAAPTSQLPKPSSLLASKFMRRASIGSESGSAKPLAAASTAACSSTSLRTPSAVVAPRTLSSGASGVKRMPPASPALTVGASAASAGTSAASTAALTAEVQNLRGQVSLWKEKAERHPATQQVRVLEAQIAAQQMELDALRCRTLGADSTVVVSKSLFTALVEEVSSTTAELLQLRSEFHLCQPLAYVAVEEAREEGARTAREEV
ncbi:hypothetical protein EON66_04710, partial [archaeon]